MPLYEYECDACSHRFEVIQKLSDPPIEKCPVCGGTVHKLQSAPSFQFKGTGWYATDYAKKDPAKTTKSDGGGADGAKESKEKTDTSEKSSSKGETSSSTSTYTPAPSTKNA